MLDLTCRCGWTKSFDPNQIGIQFRCPQCDREFPITDDPVAFSTGNIGATELSFADEVEVAEEAPHLAPRSPRPQPGSSRSPGASVSYRPATGSRTLRHMKRDRRASHARNQAMPVLLVIAGVGIVAAIALSVLSRSDRESSLTDARSVTDQAIEALRGASTAGSLAFFTSAVSAKTLMSDFEGVREKLGHLDFEFGRIVAPEKGSIDELTIVYHARKKSRGVECKFEVARVGGNWKIRSYALRSMAPAEL